MTSRFVLPFADVGSGITPSDGAKLTFKNPGLETLKNTFSDAAGSIANTNPVIADATGLFSNIYIDGNYDVVLQDKNNVQIWADSVSEFLTSSETILPFDTMILAADAPLDVGDVVRVKDRASELFDVVLTSGVTPNTLDIVVSTNDPLLSLQYRFDNVIKTEALGGTQAAINRGEVLVTAFKILKITAAGTIALTGDFALNFQTQDATYDFDALFTYDSDDRAITFGTGSGAESGTTFNMNVKGYAKLQRTFTGDGSLPAATALMGTGFRFRNVGDMDASDFTPYAIGFGIAFAFDSQDGNTTASKFGKMIGHNCLVDYSFGVGSDVNDFTSELDFYHIRNVYNRALFSDSIGSIGVRFNGSATGRDVDSVRTWGGGIEARKERKYVFDRAESCIINDNYYDPGAYANSTDYQVEARTGGTASAGVSTITLTSHGIITKSGDMVEVTSATNPLDVRRYTVGDGSNANVIVLLTPFISASTSDVDFTYFNTQIEFTVNAVKCEINGGTSLDQNVITDAGYNRNSVIGTNLGIQRGTAAPLSLDEADQTTREGLQLLTASLASKNAVSYMENRAIQANAGIGTVYLGGVTGNYSIPMAKTMAQPSSKGTGEITCAFETWTAHNPGTMHLTQSISGDGIVSVFGGNNGTESGEHKTFVYENDALADLGAIDLPNSTYGNVTVTMNGETALYNIQEDGVVTKVAGTTNTTTTDSAGNLSVFDNGTNARVRNRLGVAVNIIITYNYGAA